jgi:SRF-type transcription factor (DNA-binding and dimerisation domain)
VTYNKRKNSIAKKAKELAILCDTDVLLLLFSPKGKADLTLGPNRQPLIPNYIIVLDFACLFGSHSK